MPKSTNFYVKLFADDTFLSQESDNFVDLQKKVNKEPMNVSRWLEINKLTLNISKTKYMLVTNKNKPQNEEFQIKVVSTKIENCTHYKYLGVLLDEKLSWKPHVEHICNKISKVCGIFSKLRHATSFHLLKQVYHALVASHLQYCNLAWGNAAESVLSPLKKIQNRIIRIISFAPFACHKVQDLYNYLTWSKFIKLQKQNLHTNIEMENFLVILTIIFLMSKMSIVII